MARPRRVDPEDQLTLTEHLDELRSRLVVSVSVLVVVIALAFWKWEELLHWLAKPASAAVAPDKIKFLQTGPTDAFFTAFSLSMDIAILVTLPLLTYQIYAFVIPAFSREHHKRISVARVDDPGAVRVGRRVRVVPRASTGAALSADVRRQRVRRPAARDASTCSSSRCC